MEGIMFSFITKLIKEMAIQLAMYVKLHNSYIG